MSAYISKDILLFIYIAILAIYFTIYTQDGTNFCNKNKIAYIKRTLFHIV